MQSDRTNPPRLAHTGHHTGDTEAEGKSSSETDGELGWLIIDFQVIAREAAFEDEVVGQGDTGVYGEPVGDEIHEILQDGLEVGVAWDGDG